MAANLTRAEAWIAPVTNVSDFIWAGLWNGQEVLPFPPMIIALLGLGLWMMIGLRFYPITKLGSAFAGLFKGRKAAGAGEISPFFRFLADLGAVLGTRNWPKIGKKKNGPEKTSEKKTEKRSEKNKGGSSAAERGEPAEG